ncbi:MAG: FAD-binding domain-containing protein [Cytophagales bacterium]|nr:FAD-binding domain-containing protein [Cytophagales bacterium]
MLQGHLQKNIEKLVQELAWREYFQRVWKNMGAAIWNDIRQPQPDVLHHQLPGAIENATTGIDALDQHIQNLYDTGYMHNHVRMYTASIVCNIAKVHWLQPSRWLYYHYLDGDIASNTSQAGNGWPEVFQLKNIIVIRKTSIFSLKQNSDTHS